MTPDEIFRIETNELNTFIKKKEKLFDEIFQDSLAMKTFKNYDQYPLQTTQLIQKFRKEALVYVYIYKNHELKQWSNNVFVPENDLNVSDKTKFIKGDSRYFIAKKKTIGDISIVAYSLIQRYTNINNPYLKSTNRTDIYEFKNIEIADFSDNSKVKNIYNDVGDYLFSVKLKTNNQFYNNYTTLGFVCWVISFFFLLILINSISHYIAKKRHPWWSVCFFIGSFILLYLIFTLANPYKQFSGYDLFNPDIFYLNALAPNLWSLLIISIGFVWSCAFPYTYRDRLSMGNTGLPLWQKYSITFSLSFSTYFLLTIIYLITEKLIVSSSSITLDVSKLVEFNYLSWTIIIILSLLFIGLNLFTDFIIFKIKKLYFNINQTIGIYLSSNILAFFIFQPIIGNFAIAGSLLCFLMIVKTYHRKIKKYSKLAYNIIILLTVSLIISIYYNHFFELRTFEKMTDSLESIQIKDEEYTEKILNELDDNIQNDEELKHLIEIGYPNINVNTLIAYLQNKYASGYLSKYEFKAYFYDQNNRPLSNYDSNKLAEHREKVIGNAIKLTNNFYQLKGEIGTVDYFSLIRIPIHSNLTISILLNFRNRAFSYSLPFPEILTDSRYFNLQNNTNTNYSLAIYKEGNLISQFGSYTFPNSDKAFPASLINKTIQFTEGGFNFALNKPNAHETYVISKNQKNFWSQLATISFILFVMWAITMAIIGISQFFLTTNLKLSTLRFHFYRSFTQIKYATRIQSSIIVSVVLAILISAIILFISLNKQIYNNNNLSNEKFISAITKRLETQISVMDHVNKETILIDALSNLNKYINNDFTLYSKNGKLLYASQPRIYDLNLLSEYINPVAYNDLSVLKKNESLQKESIGTFNFEARYSTIRDDNFNTVAYLGFPNFSLLQEDNSNKNLILNTIINIYTIIIIIFGFYSIIIAQNVTNPLAIISRKISQLRLGQKNEPIYWEKNDEIGLLIKEYNMMILKLEDYADKIKDSERQNTWREMAQQVAHEIKNPLTPMKLGVQQLKRSFNDNDPRFEERFQKFSNAFIEQINALTFIASEFSAFAKLPDTKMEQINIIEKIHKSIDLYANNAKSSIIFRNNTSYSKIMIEGDRNQLLRSFNNLITNAIESGYGRRKIHIEIDLKQVDEQHIQIDIADNGSGIPDNIKERIYQINFTTKSSGTGLGLVFVKNTLESINGAITFETQEGVGTVFHLLMPFSPEKSS